MPTIDIPDRICPHCGGIRWRVEQEKRKYWVRTRYRCAKKIGEKHKRWSQANPEKVREYQIGRKKDWKTPKYRKYARERSAKHSAELTDKYIKYTLRKNPIYRNATITPQMIERQRQCLKVQRQLKNLENGKRQQTEQAEADRRRSLSNGRESKERIREIQQSQLSKRSSVSLSLQHASNERSNALCSTRNKKVNRNQLKFNKMGRKTMYSPEAIQEMKSAIRTGRPIVHLAEEFSSKWGYNLLSLKNKMYSLAKRTYKIREWKGRKRRTTTKAASKAVATSTSRIERYDDHIRIYF